MIPYLIQNLLTFLSQGFHFQTHAVQTIVTCVFLAAVTGVFVKAIYEVIYDSVVRRRWGFGSARITVNEWLEAKRQLGQADTDALKAVGFANNASLAAQTCHQAAVAALTDFSNRLTALESAPKPQPDTISPSFTELRLETSNTLDEVREEVRVFMEGVEQRLTTLEVEALPVWNRPKHRKR